MKLTGIIAEYNPFHNGHDYHLKKALEITGSDAAVVVMSGNFVQRGTPALMPKHLRTEAALKGGASVVLELPTCFSCGSAELFAKGAVSLLESLGCIDTLCFGSECGDIGILSHVASILAKEPEDFKLLLQERLRKGYPFPAARKEALAGYMGSPCLAQVLDEPNNALGIEYLKALFLTKSRIRPYTVARCGCGHHESTLSEGFSSASAIRTQIAKISEQKWVSNDAWDAVSRQIPSFCLPILSKNCQSRYPVYSNDFSFPLRYKLLSETKESLRRYVDVTLDLANRIINRRNDFLDWDTFCRLLKTKDVTYTRISRVLLHILLDIKKDDLTLYAKNGFACYARLLGFSRKDKGVLREIKLYSQIPLITSPARVDTLSDAGKKMIETDCFASNLYESAVSWKFRRPFIEERKQEIRVL